MTRLHEITFDPCAPTVSLAGHGPMSTDSLSCMQVSMDNPRLVERQKPEPSFVVMNQAWECEGDILDLDAVRLSLAMRWRQRRLEADMQKNGQKRRVR